MGKNLRESAIGAPSKLFTRNPLSGCEPNQSIPEEMIMPTKKVTVHAKARPALPESANRPKTKVAGSVKKNTRMKSALTSKEAKTATRSKVKS